MPTLAEALRAISDQAGKCVTEEQALLARIAALEDEVSRLRRTVVPFYWAPITVQFVQGTAGSVNLMTFLVNPQNLPITFSVYSGTLPTGTTLNGMVVSYDGVGGIASVLMSFRATSGGHQAESAQTSVNVVAGIPVGNRPPVWSVAENYALLPVATVGTATTYPVAAYASDPDNDPLTFLRSGGTAPAQVTVSAAGAISVPNSIAAGSYTVVVDVDDGQQTGQVTGLAVTSFGATFAALQWTAAASATSYKVERSPQGSVWTQIGTATSTLYSDTTLTASTLYYYRVRGTGPLGDGAFSANVTVTTTASAPVLASAYRYGQPHLFQPVAYRYEPNRLTGGTNLDVEQQSSGGQNGPNWQYVDLYAGWPWTNSGGDWLDLNSVPQGTTPWASVVTNAVSGGTAQANYSIPCTALLQYIQSNSRWPAMIARCPTAARAISGKFGTTPPTIDVVYTDLTTATLNCWLTGQLSTGTSYPNTTNAEISLPCALEFDPPTKAVQSAQMNIRVTQHWSGSNPVLGLYLCNPPVNTASVAQGLAASVALDAGLVGNPAILGMHRYLDGTAYTDFVHTANFATGNQNIDVPGNWDPAVLYNGTANLTKLPHVGAGKWINVGTKYSPFWSLITSAYSGDGFVPLAVGVGAMRVSMPRGTDVNGQPIHDGSLIFNGDAVADSMIFLPADVIGLLDHIFVRQYVRIGVPGGGPYLSDLSSRYQVLHSVGGTPVWSDKGGKNLLTPSHKTPNGGYSGSSGGGYGFQLRSAWHEVDQTLGGPSEGGWEMGHHLFDFQAHNPTGYSYGGEQQSQNQWSQTGGLGMLYANRWYCLETELKLNTVMAGAPGFLPDGELRTWVDGRLAYERTGMVFRSLPKFSTINVGGVGTPVSWSNDQDAPALLAQGSGTVNLTPFREIGIRDVLFNWFNGGVTQNCIDRVMFLTGLAWGTSYIGPMKLS